VAKQQEQHGQFKQIEAQVQGDDFQRWCRLVPKSSTVRDLGSDLPRFLQQAQDLINRGAETRQTVICRLATENGLCRINEVIESIERAGGRFMPTPKAVLESLALPLLKILSNRDVLSSFVLEHAVDTIFNFLFGRNGRRSIILFGFVAQHLSELKAYTEEDAVAALDASIMVFSKIIDLNGGSILIDEFRPFAQAFANAIKMFARDLASPAYARAYGISIRLQMRLETGAALPFAEAQTQMLDKIPAFKLKRDAPGDLSDLGPRHDNDSACISHIRIMPTALEIKSSRLEYFPGVDPFHFHVPGVEGLLDRHFRLLREDNIRLLRDEIRMEIDTNRGHNAGVNRAPHSVRTFAYHEAELYQMNFHRSRGLDLIYRFPQPAAVYKMRENERRKWWQSSRRLQNGALVCVLDFRGNPLFCSVSSTGLSNEKTNGPKAILSEDLPVWTNVYADANLAYVVLSLVETDVDNTTLALENLDHHNSGSYKTILEFPSILLPSFQPTLQALQRMQGNLKLPFAEFLAPVAPVAPGSGGFYSIPPPVYATTKDFTFDLSCLTDNEPMELSVSSGNSFDLAKFQRLSKLDEAQTAALVATLNRSLALIQGPPGTGKSFTGIALIRVLLANQAKAFLGPIICVCYTNHALDQLLETLVKHKVKQVIRVGSRSKSEALQDLTLRNVTRKMQQTQTERLSYSMSKLKMTDLLHDMNRCLHDPSAEGVMEPIKRFLLQNNQNHAHELFRGHGSDDRFPRGNQSPLSPLHNWLSCRGKMNTRFENNRERSIVELEKVSLFSMSRMEREKLHSHWIAEMKKSLKESLLDSLEDYAELRVKENKAKEELDLRCLQQASIVGVTTTGLARIVHLLERLESKVLICEEAGEVLEAHTLSTLLPSIEHVILIGDHLQLRPHIQNYDLQSDSRSGKQYSLDMSLFERLVQPPTDGDTIARVPFSVLETQRRMHPSIAALIQSTLYPTLKNSGPVAQYPEVLGMRKRLFWHDHRNLEAKASGDQLLSTSHSNDFEVAMVAALVAHLVRQGAYRSTDIAIITPYLGQLRKLQTELGKMFAIVLDDRDLVELESKGIDLEKDQELAPGLAKTTLLDALRIATVDNFQGEEAKIVVVSLVRSNKENKCGFLRTPNRINVLLSRAQHGMYIIGNSETSRQIPMWDQVIQMLEEQGNLGTSIQLCCPRHPDTAIEIKAPDDFSQLSPEGGCYLRCVQRLACGHACISKCHSDIMHAAVRCLEACHRSVPGCQLHPCPKPCGDKCPEVCNTIVPKVELPCGHFMDLPCHAANKPSDVKCSVLVDHEKSSCGHRFKTRCSNIKPGADIPCTASCDSPLSCGHTCKRQCRDCCKPNAEVNHGKCAQPCGRDYSACSHKCTKPCHPDEACGLCRASCDVRCIHSACKKRCSEPCAPCAESQCASACPHQRCFMPCAVPCDWLPCSKRCDIILRCGHRCPSVCGEQCPIPKFCLTCCTEDIKNLQVDYILGQTYKEIDLDEDPCIFPPCGHIVTKTNLDGNMDMVSHYSFSDDGTITGIRSSSAPFSSTDYRRCPVCRGSLRTIARYGRLVKRALLDESTRRLLTWAHKEYLALESRLDEAELEFSDPEKRLTVQCNLELVGNCEEQLRKISSLPGFLTNFKAIGLRKDIMVFVRQVQKDEQPYQIVNHLVENAQRRKGLIAQSLPEEMSTVHFSHHNNARLLALRCDLTLFSKVISSHHASRDKKAISASLLQVDFSSFRKVCVDVVANAELAQHPLAIAEGHFLFGRFVALEMSVPKVPRQPRDMKTPLAPRASLSIRGAAARESVLSASRQAENIEALRQDGLEHLDLAASICREFPAQTRAVSAELESVRRMLQGSFYSEVSSEERRAVLAAMQNEFRGTGHW